MAVDPSRLRELEKNHLEAILNLNVDKIFLFFYGSLQRVSTYCESQSGACLFPKLSPLPFPPRYTFFFCLHEGQDPEKLVFLNPPVTGQESCQSEECKQRLQNAPPPLLANRDVRLVTIQGSAQLARGAFARHFADEKREKGRRK